MNEGRPLERPPPTALQSVPLDQDQYPTTELRRLSIADFMDGNGWLIGGVTDGAIGRGVTNDEKIFMYGKPENEIYCRGPNALRLIKCSGFSSINLNKELICFWLRLIHILIALTLTMYELILLFYFTLINLNALPPTPRSLHLCIKVNNLFLFFVMVNTTRTALTLTHTVHVSLTLMHCVCAHTCHSHTVNLNVYIPCTLYRLTLTHCVHAPRTPCINLNVLYTAHPPPR